MTENKNDELYKITTLDELGPNLPVLPNTLNIQKPKDRSFSFIEWDMEIEEKISEIQSKVKNVGSLVSQMMGLLIDQFCGQDFQSLPQEQKVLTLNQLEFPNVMYMFIYLRTEELGYDLKMDVTCPSCKKLNKDFIADLRTLEVHQKDEAHQRVHVYDLIKPILLENGDVVQAVHYDVSKWDAMERATSDVADNAGKMKQLLFRSSVTQVEVKAEGDKTKNYPLDVVIKKLKKVDIEKISSAITQNNAGPLMAMKGTCVHCKAEWYRVIDWSYNYFFDSSSL